MKKLITILIHTFILNQLVAQNFQGYYYVGGKPHYWQEDSTSVNIIIGNMQHYDVIVRNLQGIFADEKDKIWADNEDDNIIVNSSQLPGIHKDSLIATIRLNTNDIVFFSYAKRINGEPIWLRNEVLVKYKECMPMLAALQTGLSQYDLISIEENPDNEYSILCKNERDVIEISNMLYDSNIVEYSTPDFYSNIILQTSDPYYPQ